MCVCALRGNFTSLKVSITEPKCKAMEVVSLCGSICVSIYTAFLLHDFLFFLFLWEIWTLLTSRGDAQQCILEVASQFCPLPYQCWITTNPEKYGLQLFAWCSSTLVLICEFIQMRDKVYIPCICPPVEQNLFGTQVGYFLFNKFKWKKKSLVWFRLNHRNHGSYKLKMWCRSRFSFSNL